MRQQKQIFYLGLIVLVVWLRLATASAGAAPQQTAASEKNQPVALPPAKEDLIGELSDEPREVEDVVLGSDGLRFAAKIKRGKQWVLVVDGKEGPTFEDIAGISFSVPGAQHVVYAAKQNGKWKEMLDGKELGPDFDAPVPDPSKNPRNAAGAMWMPPPPAPPGSAGSLLNGVDAMGMLYTMLSTRYTQPVAPTAKNAANAIQGSSWVWQNDALQHHAYGGRLGKTSLMIIDGKGATDFGEVGGPVFSADGKRLAYAVKRQKEWRMVMDGAEGPACNDIGAPIFSVDGSRLAYGAKMEKQWSIVEGANAGPKFMDISPPYFSPDGKRLAYWAKRQTKKGAGGSEVYVTNELVVADEKEGPEFDAVGPPVFSPDSQHLAYWAKGKKKERALILDGQPKFEFEEILAGPQFSPDSQHLAYVDWRNGGFVGAVDGKSVAESKAPGRGSLLIGKYFAGQISFSSNSRHMAYVVGWGGENYWEGATARAKQRAVVDGHEQDLYDTFRLDLTFSPDTRHFIYVVHGGASKDKNKSTVVIDGREAKVYDDVFGGAFRDTATEGDSPQHAFVYIAREGRKFYRVTQPLP